MVCPVYPHRFRSSLFFIVTIVLGLFTSQTTDLAQAQATSITLVNTIRTSSWSPPSPDPAGIAYWPAHDTLMVTDSEVDEMAIFQGVNLFEATRAGSLYRTHTTMPFSKEPVSISIAVNPGNGHFFISDDNQKKVFEVDIGRDERIGTGDDVVKSFSTSAYGNNDPEGLAYGRGKLYLTDGVGTEVYVVDPGPNGVFDGVPPAGDDRTSHFDVAVLGQRDPEGIAFNSATGTLFLASRKSADPITEVTVDGAFVRNIDISSLKAVGPSDLTFAPASNGSGALHLYITDRGIDNNVDPQENDGKIYEVSLGGTTAPPATPTGLAASPGNQQVSLSWNAAAGATSYRVKRSLTAGGPYTTIGSPTVTSFVDSGLTNGTAYYYVVSAVNSAGQSGNSNEVTATPRAGSERLANGSFELDANNDSKPDSWSTSSKFTRSAAIVPHDGRYVGRFLAGDNSSTTIKQRVSATTAPIQLSCWVNIPATSDAFTFLVRVQWRNASNSTISTQTVTRYADDTGGQWSQAAGTLTPPAGTTSAVVILRAVDLNATIYVDHCSLQQ